ncbi:protein phosphatase 1 regulatory subunit 12B-like isoform X5 [Clupea harengus]|uniref:Protein phosphatase 1 regulatory subunit 12B-like isoform X5 n=1 Tax=Clupea harengus TaxID=7950 RepID=A0A6P3VN37_CLUHA|nr:protein phosphatase 1 regulatory subunit 12B-like isoform X5 [Clupea harengus]
MSSLYHRNKDLSRTRKSLSDSPPSSPTATTQTFRHERASRSDSSGGDGASDRLLSRTTSYTRRENRLASLNKTEEDSGNKDYRKKQDRISERSGVYESEKREKLALEKKVSDMEEELKAVPALVQVQAVRRSNERLLAENRAMLRVLARLSEMAALPESEDL